MLAVMIPLFTCFVTNREIGCDTLIGGIYEFISLRTKLFQCIFFALFDQHGLFVYVFFVIFGKAFDVTSNS